MNGQTLRQFAAIAAIAGAVILATWMFVAAPALARHESARDRLDRANETLAALHLPAAVDRGAALRTLTDRAAFIDAQGSLARQPLQIYDAILALADEHDIQIDRMDPTGAAGARSDDSIKTIGFEIEALGDFVDMLAFMDAIEQQVGFARITTASIEPRLVNEERLVSAILRTRHFAFDLLEAESLLTTEGQTP